MLPQSWLLTILVPLALGAPVPSESNTPTLTLLNNLSNAKSSAANLPKAALDPANKHGSHRKGNKNLAQGSPSLQASPAFSTGQSANTTTLNDQTGTDPHKMGLNHANKMSSYQFKGQTLATNLTFSNSDQLHAAPGSDVGDLGAGGGGAESSGELAETSGGMVGGAASGGRKESAGSLYGGTNVADGTTVRVGAGSGSAGNTGNGGTTVGGEGTTTIGSGTDSGTTTTCDNCTISGTTASGNGTASS